MTSDKITTEQLLKKMREQTEVIDLSHISKLAHDYDVCIDIEWSKDNVEIMVRPN